MPQLTEVDVSVTVRTTGARFDAGVAVKLKPALGTVQGWGVGVGVGDGEADGTGTGVGVGVGVGVGPGVLRPLTGSVSRCTVAEPVKVTFWLPPKKTPMSGVSIWK